MVSANIIHHILVWDEYLNRDAQIKKINHILSISKLIDAQTDETNWI